MISSSVIYLFILSFVATSFAFLAISLQRKGMRYTPFFLLVFFVIAFLEYKGFFVWNKELDAVFTKAYLNLLPAMLFLYFLEFDVKAFFVKNGIGCSCFMGARRYWQLLLLALLVSFILQVVSLLFPVLPFVVESSLLASLFGLLLSLSAKLKPQVVGAKDIATTMFYLLVALFASKYDNLPSFF